MKKSKIIAALGIISSLIVIIVILGITSRPYLTVSEIVADPASYDEKEIQVTGIVKAYEGDDDNFYLKEDGDKLRIRVSGVNVPNDLENGDEIVVTGTFDAKSYHLSASEIISECS